MKRMFLFTNVFLWLVALNLSAQVNTEDITYPLKSSRLAVLAEGNFNSAEYPGRYGVSAAAKYMIKAQKNKDAFNEYVISFRASHSPASDGSFLKGFDGGNYNNISALLLTAGYRFNFGIPRYMIHHFNDDVGGWFIEVTGGVTYIHYSRTWAPAITPAVGYAVAPHVDIVGSFIGAWASKEKKKTSLFINTIGIQYNF